MSNFQPLPAQKTNGLAIAGFVTSLCCCSIVGIILSAIALSQIKNNPNEKGKGLAQAGLIIGIITFVITILYYGAIAGTLFSTEI